MRMIVQSICHYLLGMVFRRRHASTMPLPPHGWTSAQTAKDAPFLRGVLLLRWAKSRLRLRELASNHTAAVQGRVEVHVIAGGVRHRVRRGWCRRGRRRGSRGRGRHGSRSAAGGDQDRRGGYASEYAHIRSSLWVHPLYGWSRRSDDEAEQAYKHGFCRGRSSLSSGGHPPPLAAYPGTARATPWSPYAALLQVALARFTPLARVRHCGAGLASRRRGVTPYLALWSPDFPRRLSPTRPSGLLGFVILPCLPLIARLRRADFTTYSQFASFGSRADLLAPHP